MLMRANHARWRERSRSDVRRPTLPISGRPMQAAASPALPTSCFSAVPRGLTRSLNHAANRPHGHPKPQRFSQSARVGW